MEFQTRYGCNVWPEWMPIAFQVGDLLVWLAYMLIPFWLLVLWVERRDVLPRSIMLVKFIAFIFLCGSTHILGFAMWYLPWYRVYAIVLALTAAVSLYTALRMRSFVRHVLNLPSPNEVARLRQRLDQLQAELEQHRTESIPPFVWEMANETKQYIETLKSGSY